MICLIAVGVGDVVECAVSFITCVSSGNLSTSLSNVARVAAHPKFVWVFNAKYDGDPI
jgi:hypothetical protein